MKTESFNWQRPTKVCNGIKDFGLLREKYHAADDIKRNNFSSIYVSRAVFVVGVIAVITFVICLVLADKYQKSVDLSHHYASFVYERGRGGGGGGSALHSWRNGSDERERNDDVFSAAAFVKLQNISSKLPIEEINLLLPMPVTTVLRSLNASATARNGRQFSSLLFQSTLRHQHDNGQGKRTLLETATNNSSETMAVSKKPLTQAVHSLADLLKRTELKTVREEKPSTTSTNRTMAVATATATTITTPIATPRAFVHFAQLESYGHRKNAKNMQDLIKYISCNSTNDCLLKTHQQQPQPQPPPSRTSYRPSSTTTTTTTTTTTSASASASASTTKQFNTDRYMYTDTDTDTDTETDTDTNTDTDSSTIVPYYDQQWRQTGDSGINYEEYNGKRRVQTTRSSEQTNFDNVLFWSPNVNDYDGVNNNDADDSMYAAADTRAAAPLYYLPVSPSSLNAAISGGTRVSAADPFHNFRASSPLEINRLELHEQTESAAGQMLHRFSNRMYHGRGGGGDNSEIYSPLTRDLEPYLKPPTLPPPTTLSFTPSYTTGLFDVFNDASASLSSLSSLSSSSSSSSSGSDAIRDNAPNGNDAGDLRSEATMAAVDQVTAQIKPISLMVEIFPANEYELPGSLFSGGSGPTHPHPHPHPHPHTRSHIHSRGYGNGIHPSNQASPTSTSSLMSWKLAPFSNNKMRLLVNLFPQHRDSEIRDNAAPYP